jgi:hypothetical protein
MDRVGSQPDAVSSPGTIAVEEVMDGPVQIDGNGRLTS